MMIQIERLMETSGVKFGTSGARGLVVDMTDRICYAYTKGFLDYLRSKGELDGVASVAVAGDLRPSTRRIMAAVHKAIVDSGLATVNCGEVPSPAVAFFGLERAIPAIMVTGSHIPADRNGIKFNKTSGEVLKSDEAGMKAREVDLDEALFDDEGMFHAPVELPSVDVSARTMYVRRYLDFFPNDCLIGKTIGLYQHSAVGREVVAEILAGLGADVIKLGFSDEFIPVDTEAIRPEDVELAARWTRETSMDAIVSTDGDSDRPLVGDEKGRWLRGDVAGILCAGYLGADSISTPVSCNTAVEKCGFFKEISRTRIGSPYVIESMLSAVEAGRSMVVGYEANGGFLTASDSRRGGSTLKALPTRDAVIVLLSVILLADREEKLVSELIRDLPRRFTASDRLKNFPREESKAILDRFSSNDEERNLREMTAVFGETFGRVRSVNRTDGVRITFENEEIIHLRPSGNAPEFRCYTEADSPRRAKAVNAACMDILRSLRGNG